MGTGDDNMADALVGRMEGMLDVVRKVNEQFKDPEQTTFVGVCIPEFLSLYETERLVQELARYEIDVRNIVINQLIFPEAGACAPCCSIPVGAAATVAAQRLGSACAGCCPSVSLSVSFADRPTSSLWELLWRLSRALAQSLRLHHHHPHCCHSRGLTAAGGACAHAGQVFGAVP
jgi:Anion-transporting ATPase